jgi:glutathionylspermidine synthase
VGFHFHSIDEHGQDQAAHTDKFLYWREDVAYRFTAAQVEQLYEATRTLHLMCVELAGELVQRGELDRLRLGPRAQALVEASWRRRDPHLYGRFDLTWQDGRPKLLEYNADTPTSLIESAVAQWQWLQDVHPGADQFNSLHEALVAQWRLVAARTGQRLLHLAGSFESQEDVGNLEYMLDAALQAGLQATLVDVEDIGVTAEGRFVDGEDRDIGLCFKLYPWEFMVTESFGQHLGAAPTAWVEPAWKMLLSNKAILPLLWERHRGHPNLLEAHFDPALFGGRAFVRKPLLSREGANISLIEGGRTLLATEGDYGSEGFVCQAHAPLPAFAAPESTGWHGPQAQMHAVMGAWVVGDEAVGLCVREDVSPVTKDTSYFVPHYFVD